MLCCKMIIVSYRNNRNYKVYEFPGEKFTVSVGAISDKPYVGLVVSATIQHLQWLSVFVESTVIWF